MDKLGESSELPRGGTTCSNSLLCMPLLAQPHVRRCRCVSHEGVGVGADHSLPLGHKNAEERRSGRQFKSHIPTIFRTHHCAQRIFASVPPAVSPPALSCSLTNLFSSPLHFSLLPPDLNLDTHTLSHHRVRFLLLLLLLLLSNSITSFPSSSSSSSLGILQKHNGHCPQDRSLAGSVHAFHELGSGCSWLQVQ